MTAAHTIDLAWLSTGSTGAQNYDEFADESKITRIIEANPTSMLAVEMPDRTPEARAAGLSFEQCLPAAAERLQALEDAGRFAPAKDVAVAYRITDSRGGVAYGLFCMVDTDEISTSADEPGRVIRNEDVFIEKVRQRAALNNATRHLMSPVLLVQSDNPDDLQAALAAACSGEPAVSDVDEAGRTHAVWPIAPGATQGRLLELAGGGELIVADGNHRSLAAQVGELPRFLAVVTTPDSVTIDPYHRLVADPPLSGAELLDALRAKRATVTTVDGPLSTPESGTVHLYVDGAVHAVGLPDISGSIVDRLDHARVEHVLFNDVLGMDAGDKRITYVGGDYPPSWLAEQVDAGAADLAVLIAPVTVDDFIAVNLARLKLPRKSTWFTPKARAGLVLADLRG
ncbi:MAG TPA: DUF1015 family protein [Stackebrandtia sp.]|uniref:DUF1015 family protein n=1 Tax=Stackebrandtia sp. TaxID=2023065 RepID=UPI002D49DBAC|nr:DUF1015 family protein [Stackebrandtia sp.]HZE41919.1 DUF1015 family protein [Stackebrandtia sp.]